MKRRRSRSLLDSFSDSTVGGQVEQEFNIYCQKWTLRALIELGGHNSVLHDGHCSEPGLIRSLGLDIDFENDYKQSAVLDALKKKHRELVVSSLPEVSTSALMQNIRWLTEQLKLTRDEQTILFFCVLERQSIYLRKQLGANEDAINAWCATWITDGFSAYEALLAADKARGAFSYGNTPTLADVYLVPQVESARRFKVDLTQWPLISSVEKACVSLEAFQRAAPSQQPDAS